MITITANEDDNAIDEEVTLSLIELQTGNPDLGRSYITIPDPMSVLITLQDNDAAPPSGITGEFTGAVTERGALNPGQIEIATGTLVLTSGTFIEQTGTSSTYGSFDLGTDGTWTYTLDNASVVTNALAAGEEMTDEFTVTTTGDPTGTVTITVTGADDAPTITGVNFGGQVTEDDAAMTTVTGTLTVTDPDSNVAFVPQNPDTTPNTYGTFTLTAAGVWTYTLDNERPATNALAQNAQPIQDFMVEATTATPGQTPFNLFIVVNGANDPPIANAGPDQLDVLDGATVTLDGSLSRDVDDDVRGYDWEADWRVV